MSDLPAWWYKIRVRDREIIVEIDAIEDFERESAAAGMTFDAFTAAAVRLYYIDVFGELPPDDPPSSGEDEARAVSE